MPHLITLLISSLISFFEWLNTEHAFSISDTRVMGIFGGIGFTAYYYVWHDLYPQPYENLELRVIASIICILPIFHKYWPSPFKPYIGIYWNIGITYCLPFLFSFLLLKNQYSTVTVSTYVIGTFVTVLLIADWTLALFLWILGSAVGVLSYLIITPNPNLDIDVGPYIGICLFAIFTAILLNVRNRRAIRLAEKFHAQKTIANNLAHELRTPLQAIESGAVGIQHYLPDLFTAYEAAQAANLGTPQIPSARYPIIKTGLQRIQQMAQQGNYIVSMASRNLAKPTIDDSLFAIIDIAEAVNKAISSYPYNHKDKSKLIETIDLQSFNARVSETLVIHIIYNLLQNALYYVAKASSNDARKIRIEAQLGNKNNKLIIIDTGTGIPSHILPHIFERFYTKTPGGNGVGLSFVKQAMEAFDGSVTCDSTYGEYTRFVLKFPSVKSGDN